MKHIFYTAIAAAFALMTIVGCQKEETSKTSIVDGEWHLVSLSAPDATIPDEPETPDSETPAPEAKAEGEDTANPIPDVYVVFSEGSFTLYQKHETMLRHYVYNGEFSVSGNILTGKYDDGTLLGGGAYKVEVNGDKLTMTTQNGTDEVTVYKREAVPADVKNSSVPHVKSAAPAPLPFL